jgi:hypothetical protein
MIENNLASFTIEWSPKAENNFSTVFHIVLKEGTNMNSTIQQIYEVPNLFTIHTWAKTSSKSQKIQEKLQTEGFKDIIPRIILSANYYDCWVDQLLRTK